MSRYKVLSLPAFLNIEDEIHFYMFNNLTSKIKIDPIFKRNGMYLDRKTDVCWVETRFGCWIIGNDENFKSELDYQTSNDYIIPNKVITAFKLLEKYNILPSELMLKWYKHSNAVDLKRTYLRSKLHFNW